MQRRFQLAMSMFVLWAAPVLAEETTLQPKVVEATKPQEAAASPKEGGVFANTVCTNGKNKRMVELTPYDKAANKPCEVHYKKETEQPGHDQVLWSSGKDNAFCATKAEGFVQKLGGMGWTCAKL